MRTDLRPALLSLIASLLLISCGEPPTVPAAQSDFSDLALVGGAATLLDSENVPSAADVMVIVERESGTFVVTLARDEDKAYVHRAEAGQLSPVGSYATGDGPVAVALAQRGEFAIVANSNSDDLSVMAVGLGGVLEEIRRVPSGGKAPADVAVAFDDLIIVANRGALVDGEGVTLFSVDREGNMTQVGELHPTGSQPPPTGGNDPHIIAVTTRGLVAVANSSSNDVTLLEINRQGDMIVLPPVSRPVGGSPKALAIVDDRLHVATRAPVYGQREDEIEVYDLGRDGSMTFLESHDAGHFLTDLDASGNRLVAATWGGSPSAPVNEVRTYVVNRDHDLTVLGGLSEDDVLSLPGTPSFQLVGLLGQRDRLFVAVSQFQAGALRWVQSLF